MPASIARLLPKLRQNVVRIRTRESSCSGVILRRIAETTVIATCYHILEDDPKARFEVSVRGPGGEELLGEATEIYWYDRASDFVILVTDLPTGRGFPKGVGFGRTAQARVGEEVYAIGNPRDFEQVVSRGIVSCHAQDGAVPILIYDAHVNAGNSGGPLFDTRGRLLGLVTGGGRDSEGLNIAVPIDYVMFRARPLFDLVWNRYVPRALPIPFDSSQRLETEELSDLRVLDTLRDQVQSACGLDLHRAYYLAYFQRRAARRGATEQIESVFQHREHTDHVVVHVSGTHYKLVEQRDGKWIAPYASPRSAIGSHRGRQK